MTAGPEGGGDAGLLRLLQLTSPGLPVGAFAYSQGLEYAVHAGWVTDAVSAAEWLAGLLEGSLSRLDLPLLGLSHAAWRSGDAARILHYARWLQAARETHELQEEDLHIGRALARCLYALGVEEAGPWVAAEHATGVTSFALAGATWGISARLTALGYAMSWAQNQVSAVMRLLPVGQLAGQRLLSHLMQSIPRAVDEGLSRTDEQDIGFVAFAQVVASSLHETQYSRLFRS
jgi:urease accessory protein